MEALYPVDALSVLKLLLCPQRLHFELDEVIATGLLRRQRLQLEAVVLRSGDDAVELPEAVGDLEPCVLDLLREDSVGEVLVVPCRVSDGAARPARTSKHVR